MGKISCIMGYIKLFMYKLFYMKKLKFNIRQHIHKGIIINLQGRCKFILEKNICSYNNCKFSVYDSANLTIGENTYFAGNTTVVSTKNIQIGKNVLFGPGVVIVDFNHNYKGTDLVNMQGLTSENVFIGDNVWIGANCIIMKGSKIGENSVIAGGTIVRGEIPPNSLVYNKKELVITEIKR